MSNKQQLLIQYIHEEKRSDAVALALDMLEHNEITIPDLYEQVLAKALQEIDCKEGDKECIWKEHIETAIVRTITEVVYPYIIKQTANKKPKDKRVVVVCPTEEYHEIGAKMAHDFFLLEGYDSIFIGANTPLEVIEDAVTYLQPDYLAISVTNMYNLVTAKKVVDAVKHIHPSLKIIAGGVAFYNDQALEAVGVDQLVSSYQSIKELE